MVFNIYQQNVCLSDQSFILNVNVNGVDPGSAFLKTQT